MLKGGVDVSSERNAKSEMQTLTVRDLSIHKNKRYYGIVSSKWLKTFVTLHVDNCNKI